MSEKRAPAKRIFMVEDDKNFLKACTVMLKARGYEVEAATDIKSARKLDFSRPPDVIILDIMLPDGSGLDLCREIRKTLSVPVVFITALDESSDVVAGLEAGGDIYLTKPVDFPVLMAHVEAALRRTSGVIGAAVAARVAGGSEEKKRKTNQAQPKPYFFPERLKNRLARIPDYPLTLVEAPSGFGKTTAVRGYFKDNLPVGAHENWYTCLGEPPSIAWAGICRLFGVNSKDIAEQLSKLYPITLESLPDIAALMRESRYDSDTFLVIDNYQLFESKARDDIVNAFSVHAAEKLHIIVITQPLSSNDKKVHNANIHQIYAEDFLFDRNSTARLCRLLGTKISEEELNNVQKYSEGWVAAIRLQVENYRETGSFSIAGSMDELIKMAVWNRVPDEYHEFFLALSLLNGFTEKQASIMGGWPALPKSVVQLLESVFFIPYVADKGVYSMHGILRDYLLKRFDGQPAGFIETMNRRAGAACVAVSDYFQAARFYMAIKAFDDILSLPLTARYLNDLGMEAVGFIERFVEECPEDTLLKYPFSVLAFTFQFMMGGKRELFSRMIRLLNQQDKQKHALSEAELSRVKGEVALLMSFTAFNDIAKMSLFHKEAAAHLSAGGSSSSTLVLGKTPWTFGITSVFCLFWSGVGKLDEALSLMDECLPVYSRIANGHGAGAENVFRAEAHLMRGDDAEAEAACHKAISQAGEKEQMSICLCAELVLARIAVLRGDEKAYTAMRDRITKDAEASRQRAVSLMGELCLAMLDLTLGNSFDQPEWLRDTGVIRRKFFVQGHSYVFMLHCMTLLLEGRNTELCGFAEIVFGHAREMNYMLPQVYQHIYLAVAKKNEGALTAAQEHLNAALGLALPDRVYLPFAEFGAALLPLLETVEKNFDAKKMSALKALCGRQMAGVESVNKQSVKSKLLLTPSERKVALLAKERLSVGEIASRLYISENTVKSVLKSIYGKLEIHSKTELAEKEW